MVISDVRSLSLYLSVMPGLAYAMPVACAASRQFAPWYVFYCFLEAVTNRLSGLADREVRA